MSLGLLASNFHEIYDAVHAPGKQEPDLVANIFSTRIYHSSRGWGRLWRWFYHITDFFIGTNFRLKKLRQAMEKTRKTFHDKLPLIQENINTYQTYLQKKSAGYNVKETDFHKARRTITAWNNATAPFLDLIHNGKNEKLTALFYKYFPADIEKGTYEPPFSWNENIKPVRGLQKIITIEGYLHEPLPLTILEKLAAGKIIPESEGKDLGLWIDKLNKLPSIINVSLFHDSMIAFVNYLSGLQYLEPPSLAALELELADRGLKLFTTEEAEHIQWRNELKPGDSLGKGITLGEQIGKKYYDKDKNFVFSIKEDPKKVVYIGRNRTLFGLRERINKLYSGGIPSAIFHAVDPEGRFAIMERLNGSFDHYKWKSTRASGIHPNDNDLLVPLANLVAWFIQNEVTPNVLTPKHLMFDAKGQLRYAKITMLEEFDYTVLEDFIFEAANGNRLVFCQLMNLSRLNGHPYQKFFKSMLEYALEGKKKNASTVAALDGITDPKVVDRGEALHETVKKLKESCCRKICREYKLESSDRLLETVKKALDQFYYSTNSSGILWPSAEEEVVASVVNTMKLSSRASR